jgi:hypothetical protein
MTAAPVARLNRKAASKYLLDMHGVSRTHATLAKLATVGGGPVFRKFGSRPLYEPADLDAWVLANISEPLRSTSNTLTAASSP